MTTRVNAARSRLGLQLPQVTATPAVSMPRAPSLAPLPDPAAVKAVLAAKAARQAPPEPREALRTVPAPAVPDGPPAGARKPKPPAMERARLIFVKLATAIKGGWPEVVLPLTPIPDDQPVPVLANGACAKLQKRLAPSHHARLRKAFGLWTQSPRYQRALAERGAVRRDLHGNPVAPVDDETRATARRVIEYQGW